MTGHEDTATQTYIHVLLRHFSQITPPLFYVSIPSKFNFLIIFQNSNLERALDWIFTHPEEDESDALSDMADTEPNDTAFSIANSHSDSTLSPDRDTTGPRVKDGPGRELMDLTKRNQILIKKKKSHFCGIK